jgi:aminoglycoside/choline kinase family phosphotransferase
LIDKQTHKILEDACYSWINKRPDQVAKLPVSGSVRRYFRLTLDDRTVIGAYSENPAENRAFISFSKHFRDKGLNVPEIYYENLDKNIYLLEDLGDDLLYNEVISRKKDGPFPEKLKELYRKALDHLVRFQVDEHSTTWCDSRLMDLTDSTSRYAFRGLSLTSNR